MGLMHPMLRIQQDSTLTPKIDRCSIILVGIKWIGSLVATRHVLGSSQNCVAQLIIASFNQVPIWTMNLQIIGSINLLASPLLMTMVQRNNTANSILLRTEILCLCITFTTYTVCDLFYNQVDWHLLCRSAKWVQRVIYPNIMDRSKTIDFDP